MDQYFLDERIILNKGYDLHKPLALGEKQWIDLINFLYEPRPVSTLFYSPPFAWLPHGGPASL
jgi:hypothetical protein